MKSNDSCSATLNCYKPAEFTINTYQSLLKLAKKRFEFKQYTDVLSPTMPYVLWRHDVDMSLEHAVMLAEIEHEQGISATYFIHLHNEFYNAFDLAAKTLIQTLQSLGHTLGLHFDVSYYDIHSQDDLVHWLTFEKEILARLFGQNITVFSFHNTNECTMRFESDSYSGMINTYSHRFKKHIHYCSDSNGYWRFKQLVDVLGDVSVRQLQVLTHPEWWTETELLPREKVVYHVDKRRAATLSNYDKTLELAGRLNIG